MRHLANNTHMRGPNPAAAWFIDPAMDAPPTHRLETEQLPVDCRLLRLSSLTCGPCMRAPCS